MNKTTKPQRLFVGVEISEENKRKIDEWTKPFLKIPIRWTPTEYLHITLVPPWNELDVETAKEKLGRTKGLSKQFNIQFNRVLPGPHPKPPRLIWIEGKPSLELKKLSDYLQGLFNIKSKHPNDIPHITIARFPRWLNPKDFSKISGLLCFDETVGDISLVKSELTPRGPIYTTIKRVDF